MFMVISVHVGIAVQWTEYTSAGQYGVGLFFILSGYLIFISLDSGITIREFYQKRVLRIIPEYWAALLIYWFSGVIQHLYSGGTIFEAVGCYNSPYGIRYLRYFTFTNMLFPSNDWYLWNNRHAWWTMSSFMVFYIIAPILYKVFNRFWMALMMLTLLLYFTPKFSLLLLHFLQSITVWPEEAYIEWFCGEMPLCQLYGFFFGIVVYFAIKERKQVIYIIYLLFLLYAFNTSLYLWEIIMTLCVIAVVHDSLNIGARLGKIVKFLSDGSFSVYCMHMGIVPIIRGIMPHIRGSIEFMIVFCITCVVCYCYYFMYKHLSINMRKRLLDLRR